MKAVLDAFNQEKVQVGAFSVIVQLCRLIVYSTGKSWYAGVGEPGGGCDNGDQIVNDNANASSVIILLNRFVIPLPLRRHK